jgi:hypothetical protein
MVKLFIQAKVKKEFAQRISIAFQCGNTASLWGTYRLPSVWRNSMALHHHHQPFNVPTAGAQAFLMD